MPPLKEPKIPGESATQRKRRFYKIWAALNAEKIRDKYRLWVAKNKEEVRLYNQEYGRRHYALNRSRRGLQIKNNRKANRAKYKEIHRLYDSRPDVIARRRICTKRYRKNHPEVVRAQNVARKAKLRGATSITSGAFRLIRKWKSEADFRCYYCGDKYPTLWGLHVDHITPINKGGQHEVDNLCRSCVKCNCRKGDRLVSDPDLSFGPQQLLKF